MWLLFVFLNMVISGFLDIIEKKGSNNQPLYFWAQAVFLYGILNVVLGIIFMPSVLINFDFKTMFLNLPIAFLSTFGYYCTVMAFKYCSISKIAPILRSKIIVVLILSALFIDDRLTIVQLVLIFLLLIFNILLNKSNDSKKSIKGVLFAFGYMFANGIATFLNKIVLDLVPNPISVTFYNGLTTVLSIILILLIFRKTEFLNVKNFKNKNYVLLMEILEVISMFLLRYAIMDGNIVIITAMTSSSIIIAIILSKIIFKEKISVRKWLMIILIAILLIILSIISI